MEGIYAIYVLLAVAIPILVRGLRQFNFIPNRFLPFLPAILAFVGVLFTQLGTGVGWIAALTAAIGVEGIATGGAAATLRQMYVKGIKNQ